MKQNNKQLSEIRAALATHKSVFLVVGLFSAFINLLYLSPSLYMLQVYDRVITSSNLTTLVMLSVLLLGIYLILNGTVCTDGQRAVLGGCGVGRSDIREAASSECAPMFRPCCSGASCNRR